jgi:hypothetical protein
VGNWGKPAAPAAAAAAAAAVAKPKAKPRAKAAAAAAGAAKPRASRAKAVDAAVAKVPLDAADPEAAAAGGDKKRARRTLYDPAEECVVCMDAVPTVVYSPCGHTVVCDKCQHTNKPKDCPTCKTRVERHAHYQQIPVPPSQHLSAGDWLNNVLANPDECFYLS